MEGVKSVEQKTVVLGVSGSIAAYKAVYLARALVKAGHRVIPVMTSAAKSFVGPTSFSAVTGELVRDDMYDPKLSGELHIELTDAADVVVFAPATADLLARMHEGRSDDLLSALALCAKCPVLVAPAMHPRMWEHPATQRNVAALEASGRIAFVGPISGEVASGDVGFGRMEEPEVIADRVLAVLRRQTRAQKAGHSTSLVDLQGQRVVVTAGPTVEDLDPVRFISNRSSGKMGFALAKCARARGAEVTLIAGPVSLATPSGVNRVDVRSALDMQSALKQALGAKLEKADVLIMAAAVGDYRVRHLVDAKIKRANMALSVELVPNPDLLAEIGKRRAKKKTPLLVGFAVETHNAVREAQRKLLSKNVDLVVANLAQDAFGKDTNDATIVTRTGSKHLGVRSKDELADRILDAVVGQLQ